ncbi:hypothetical protein ADUPG1_010789 [Aduncisulcus paluster]|uniref:Uncharacterized protein n=1 Tax=Aduncisulcus paluster TaxID=2918883 RepID=A0ABQ5JSV9_9EUKA|nr:hypothetical protein ADUPG1_010789 [Aduncisulcus paluster]
MSLWIPDQEWGYKAEPSLSNPSVIENLRARKRFPLSPLFDADHLPFALRLHPKHYLISIGIVFKEEDKEIYSQEKKEIEKEKEIQPQRKRRFGREEMPPKGFLHVPEQFRAPDFRELCLSELSTYVGAPVISVDCNNGDFVRKLFFSGHDLESGLFTFGSISKYSSFNIPHDHLTDRCNWLGIPCVRAESIALNSESPLPEEIQTLTFNWKAGVKEQFLSPYEESFIVGPLPSEDTPESEDHNTLFLSDPCYETAYFGVTVKDVMPGQWLGDYSTRGRVNRCQVTHSKFRREALSIHQELPKPLEESKSPYCPVDQMEGEEINGFPGWRPLKCHVGVDSGRAGFFVKSFYNIKNTQIDVTGLSPEGLGMLMFEAPIGRLGYDIVLGDSMYYDGVIVPGGYFTSSGYGDGGYQAYVLRNADGVAISLRIQFIYDDEETPMW